MLEWSLTVFYNAEICHLTRLKRKLLPLFEQTCLIRFIVMTTSSTECRHPRNIQGLDRGDHYDLKYSIFGEVNVLLPSGKTKQKIQFAEFSKSSNQLNWCLIYKAVNVI
jgi:hypothetical protein